MKAGIRIGATGMLAAGLLAGQVAFAEGPGRQKGPRKQADAAVAGEKAQEDAPERQQARQQHMEQMRERMEAQREVRKKVMEAVAAEQDAQKALAMVREHCVNQHVERTAFHAAEMEKRMAAVGGKAQGRDVDPARREAFLKEMIANMEARKGKADAHHTELLAKLDALKGKSDLTKADILAALREARPDMPQKRDGKDERGEDVKRKRESREGKERGEQMKPKREGRETSRKTAPDA